MKHHNLFTSALTLGAGLILSAMPGENPKKATPQDPSSIVAETSGAVEVLGYVQGHHEQSTSVLNPRVSPQLPASQGPYPYEDLLCAPQDIPIMTTSPSGTPVFQCIPPDDMSPAPPDTGKKADTSYDSNPPETGLETGTGNEKLRRVLKVYKYILGPGRNKKEFYYIDIPNLFAPYGPFPDDESRTDRGGFHDENRRQIAQKNPKAYINTSRDLPVPAAAGIESQRFERKLQRAKADYKGRPLIEQFGAYLDQHFENSLTKRLLQKSGHDSYFRDLVLYGLIGVESGWNPQMRTPAGRGAKRRPIFAKGLAQAVDHTQRHMEAKGALRAGLDPFIPEDAAQYCIALFDNNLQYLIEAIGKNHFLFQDANVKSLLIPLLLTSYNQGHGRLVRMAQYFIALHKNGTMPNTYYTDQKPTFTPDTMVWFLARAFTVVRSEKPPEDFTSTDGQFSKQNSGFGPDGAQYALKIMALAQTMQARFDN